MKIGGRAREAMWLIAAGVLALAAGAVVVHVKASTALGAVLVVAAAAAVVLSARGRLIVVVLGALLVFQAPNDKVKYAYLALAVAAVLVATMNLLRTSDPVERAFKPMVIWSSAMVAMLAVSLVNASSFGTAPVDWFRDALPYLLLAILPVVGMEASRGVPVRLLGGFIGVIGVVAALGFALDWLNRRGASEATGRVVLATAALSTFAFSYTLVRGALGPHRPRWLAAAGVIAMALLVTGTRTNVVLIAAAIVGACGAARKGRIPPVRILAVVAAVGIPIAILLPYVATSWLTNSAFLGERLAATVRAINGGLGADQSFQIRANSYDIGHAYWSAHPWVGGGPGHVFVGDIYSLDTPWMVPAKFGILGTAVIVCYLLAVVRSVHLAWTGPGSIFTAARSWAFSLVVLLPFGAWTEDKGASLALTLLVAGCAATAREVARLEGSDLADVGAVQQVSAATIHDDGHLDERRA